MSTEEAQGKWYIIKCPSGVENKFISELQESLKKAKISDLLIEYYIPHMMEQKSSGNRKILMANYFFLKLILTPQVEKTIHQIPFGSFLLDSQLKIAETDEETIQNLRNKDEEEKIQKESQFKVGEKIIVQEAPFVDFEGTIEKVNEEEQVASVSINILGNPIFIELPFASIKRISEE